MECYAVWYAAVAEALEELAAAVSASDEVNIQITKSYLFAIYILYHKYI